MRPWGETYLSDKDSFEPFFKIQVLIQLVWTWA